MNFRSLEPALLEALISVSESPSFDKAAVRLGITQPALSNRLKTLETQLLTPLFVTEGRRKVLSRFGREFCQLAREEIDHWKSSVEKLERNYANASQLQLRIACRRDRFAQVRKYIQFPGVIEFRDASSAAALTALLSHEVDIAIVHERPALSDFVAKPLFNSAPVVICHERWVKSTRWFESPEFMKKTPFLRYRKSERYTVDWLRLHGVDEDELNVRFICEEWEALIGWVFEGEGYAVVPGDLLQDLTAHPKVRAHHLDETEVSAFRFYAVFSRELRKIPAFSKSLVIGL